MDITEAAWLHRDYRDYRDFSSSERLGPGVPTPVASITRRSKPTPKPAWGTEPKRPSWGQADGDSEWFWGWMTIINYVWMLLHLLHPSPTHFWTHTLDIWDWKVQNKSKRTNWMKMGEYGSTPRGLIWKCLHDPTQLEGHWASWCCWMLGSGYTDSTGFRTKVPVPPIVFFWKTQPRPSAASQTTTNVEKNWKLHHTVGLEMTWGENGRKSAVVWRCLASLNSKLQLFQLKLGIHQSSLGKLGKRWSFTTATGKTSVSARCWKPMTK